jgi:hypothetical protein
MPDGHPAGIQVFLYFWVKLVGINEWAIKLPFVLMGIASVWLTFEIGKQWFSASTGLFSAALIACLQYPIMYSITARPYASGMFFGLMMVLFLTKLVKTPEKNQLLNLMGFTIFGVLCAYNHHFSLLFAFIVGLGGMFLVPKVSRIKYFISCVTMVVLYLPHLSIFIHQLSNGGVEGWLAKPDASFLGNYLRYVFNGSSVLLVVVSGIAAYGIAMSGKQKPNLKKWIFFTSLFVVPLAVGYWYSVKVNAVLQYSVLLFSFPYGLMIVFGFFKEQKQTVNLILVVAILALGIESLAKNRNYFTLIKKPHYKHLIADIDSARLKYGKVLALISSDERISEYYIKKHDLDSNYFNLNNFSSELELREFVRNKKDSFNYLYVGAWSNVNPNFLPVLKEFYPNQLWQKEYVGGSTHLFDEQKERNDGIESIFPGSKSNKKNNFFHWENVDTNRVYWIWDFNNGLTGKTYKIYELDSSLEWSPFYSMVLDEMYLNQNDFIDISVDVLNGDHCISSLVAIIENDEGTIHWKEMPFSNFINSDDSMWQTVHHSVKLSDIAWQNQKARIKTFIWNKEKCKLDFRNFTIKTRRGNKFQYGFTETF